MPSRKIRIGTRGSPLALAQARETRDRLMSAHGLTNADLEIVTIVSTGDRIQDKSLREFGGKGLFTKEIEEALLAKDIDIAVHSMKDMPTELPGGLVIGCLLPREDVRDAFISLTAASFAELPEGAVVGTASLRRQAQIRHFRPDLRVVTYRGNVQTRLAKLAAGEVDATLLACAGLRRLGEEARITAPIPTDEMLPAVGQGAIGVECREDDDEMLALLAPLNDRNTERCLAAERAFLARLDGSCRTPIAALAQLAGDKLQFQGQILLPDGSEAHEVAMTGMATEAEALGVAAAETLIARAGEVFLQKLR